MAKLSSSVRVVGDVFDSKMTLRPQVNSVSRSCFYQIRQLRTIRHYISTDSAETMVNAFVCGRLDYCNSIYVGATEEVHNKLQSVQNAVERLITGRKKYDPISEIIRQLHWLRIPQRSLCKVASIVRRCRLCHGPVYLMDYIIPVRSLRARFNLRSEERGGS